MVRRHTVAVVTAIALLVASCGSPDGPTPKAPSTTGATSTSSPPQTTRAEAVVDGVRVQATTGRADRGLELTVGPGDAAAPEAETLVVATEPVSVKLDDGAAQPSAPVRLTFDLSERPDIVSRITDTVIPVVESVSATDPTERDMFMGTWDPGSRTLTTEVTHLTDFWLSAFDVFKAIEDGIGGAFETLRGNSTSPCREKSTLTLDGTDYELTAVSPGAIAGCLVDDNGSIAIDFENATGGFYAILVSPEDIGGNWVVGQPLSMGDAAGSMIVELVPNKRGVLARRSSGRLTLNRGSPRATSA